MPEVRLSCSLCGRDAPRIEVDDDYAVHAFGYLCDRCVDAVRRAGPAPLRRARATEARVAALLAAHEGLSIEARARRRVTVGGSVAGRRVRITLRDSAREGESERFVLRVELVVRQRAVTREELTLAPDLDRLLAPSAPSVTTDGFRHLRVAFSHLGKTDLLDALDALMAVCARLDAAP